MMVVVTTQPMRMAVAMMVVVVRIARLVCGAHDDGRKMCVPRASVSVGEGVRWV